MTGHDHRQSNGCRDIADRMDLYLLGALDPEDEADVLRHLGHCPACRADVERVRVGLTQLAGIADSREGTPDVPPPEHAVASIRNTARTARRRQYLCRAGGAATAAAAAIALCLAVHRFLSTPAERSSTYTVSQAPSISRTTGAAQSRTRPPVESGARSDSKSGTAVWMRQGVRCCRGCGAVYPLVTDRTVLAFTGSGEKRRLVALSAADGSERWRSPFNTAGCSVATLNGIVFSWASTATCLSELRALRVADGAEVWRRSHASDGSPFVPGRLAASPYGLCVSTATSVALLDAATGCERWRRAQEMASGLSAPAVYGRRVIVASGATVCALDAESGRALWRIRLDTSQRALSPPTVTTGPDRLIVATNPLSARAVLHCLRPEDGSVLWKRDRGGPIHSVTVKGPAVYVRSESILALEAASGTVLWSSLMGGCSPLVALDHVVLASAGSDVPSLVALDGRTGARVWEQRLASSCSGLAVSDGTGFMAARDGALYAVRVAIPDGA